MRRIIVMITLILILCKIWLLPLSATKYGEEYIAENLEQIENEIDGLKQMVSDPEMGELAKIELEENETKKIELIKEIEILLIPKDENDGKDIVMEIRGAAGGDEANIFAGDLFRMYN